MEPLIESGARVLVDTRDTRVREGIYAFRSIDELRVKRLRRLATGEIEIRSENTFYPPETYRPEEGDDFAILGRVLWVATTI